MEVLKKSIELAQKALRSAEKYLCEDLDAICDDTMREYAEDTLLSVRKGLNLEVWDDVKVFVLFIESVYDFEYDHQIQVFSSREKAKEAFDGIVSVERESAVKSGWEVEEDEYSFYAWEDGRSSENRVSVEVNELKIN